ncbi:ABC transporter substrate-binding protein [Vallitalea guaymasensis]|uniref:Extracellular solute-binding protein n=1 Tax=Vallitalea guaymasensis TaxID=1185412 RepID=A0A8J8SDB2_9FIRM|nr:extracellular solute-binding protein [Vallitalea guaymasensis]QUH30295.1 extracellular solute-binding protein [Vallitalea guaymasensis]
MKKFLIVLSIVTLLVSSLAGCGNTDNKKEEQSNSDNESNGQVETNDNQDEEITLSFWYKDVGVKEEIYKEAVARFENKYPNVTVKTFQARSSAYKQKLPIALSGNDAPDVFFTWGGGWLKRFADEGHVLEITDKLDTSRFKDLAMVNCVNDDKVFGAPLGIDIGVVFYNKEIFEKHNLQVPKTYEELKSVMSTLRENEVIPFVLANQPKWPGSFWYMYLVDRLGGEEAFDKAFKRDGGSFNSQPFVEAGEYIQDLVDAKAFNDGYNGLPYDAGTARQLLYTDRAAMMLLSNTFINLVRKEAPDYEEKVGMFPFPTMPNGKGDENNLVGIAAPVWSISSGCEHPDLALELINELTSVETATEYSNRTGSQTAIKDIKTEDPVVQQLMDMLNNANNLQMVYDQTLVPELAQKHLETTQEVFGFMKTPQEAADEVEELAKKLLD